LLYFSKNYTTIDAKDIFIFVAKERRGSNTRAVWERATTHHYAKDIPSRN